MKKLLTILLVFVLALSVPVTSYAAGADKKYAKWSNSTAKKIRNATASKKLTISTSTYTAFTPKIRDAMMERPDVQVTVKWKQDGKTKKFVIKAGTDVSQVFDENGYAGFAYLQGYFGEKGNTKEAKAIQTRKKEAKAVAAALSLKSYAGNNEEFNAYKYYTRYADLQEAFGADGDKLLNHYNTCGKAEGRIAN